MHSFGTLLESTSPVLRCGIMIRVFSSVPPCVSLYNCLVLVYSSLACVLCPALK